MRLRSVVTSVNRDLDTMVARTPEHRDRYVDFLRVLAIGVVVIWHWALSILYWSGDRWVMPNPIHQVPGGWLATWVLQIMPVFFVVGGYANAAGWFAAQRDGTGLAGYYLARLRRLLVPIAVFVAVWALFELVAWLLIAGYPGVLRYGLITFTPLWFIAAYLWVVLLTPLTATAHARAGWLALAVLAGAVLAADLGRFAGGVTWLGWVNTALVWVLVHQLGYFYRDSPGSYRDSPGSYRDSPGSYRDSPGDRWLAVGLVVAGLALLAILTSTEAYPRSMVATVGQERSNILPTTLPIAVVAIVQLGVIMLVRAPATAWLRRRRVWKPVVAANAIIMTVFLWHMTALLVVLALLRAAGVEMRTEPTLGWWLERPLWLLAPLPVLAVLVALFAPFERAAARRSSNSRRS